VAAGVEDNLARIIHLRWKLDHPMIDPFWKAFYNALEKYKSL